jgi:hypothetical protein
MAGFLVGEGSTTKDRTQLLQARIFITLSKEIAMTRFLGVLVLIVAVVVGVGLYMGWFHIGSDTTEGQTHITLTVDQKKIKADEEKLIEKARSAVNPKRESTVPAEPQNPK